MAGRPPCSFFSGDLISISVVETTTRQIERSTNGLLRISPLHRHDYSNFTKGVSHFPSRRQSGDWRSQAYSNLTNDVSHPHQPRTSRPPVSRWRAADAAKRPSTEVKKLGSRPQVVCFQAL